MIAFSEILTDIFDTDSYCEYPTILTNNKNSIITLVGTIKILLLGATNHNDLFRNSSVGRAADC